jgi:predicted short-subunit dehydrogenase-like oxidoreductase (DUF2520 family)
VIDASHYEIRSAVILGAGNVASHLGICLKEHGISIKQVYNRSGSFGQLLAENLGASFTDSPEKLEQDTDLYVAAVSDDAIGVVISQCRLNKEALLVHTAGAVDMNILNGKTNYTGIFYPLQTFTKGKSVDFRQIPVFIEGINDVARNALKSLAAKISDQVFEASSEDRMYLHLAAVISSNFTNHLLTEAEKILKSRGYELNILKPLMLETIEKAFAISPANAQTGPAVRGNLKVIEKHLEILKDFPGVREVYRNLSESIRDSKQ